MADLDDFFAKKDRKKSKNVKKFSTADEIVKKLEDTGKKSDKPVKKERSNQEGDEPGHEIHEQDEWKDFEEEKKDYTGLKIGHLSINADGNNAGSGGSDGQGNDNSGVGDGGSDSGSTGGDLGSSQNESHHKGPWKRVQHQQQTQVEKVVEPPPAAAPASNAGELKVYVLPQLRGHRASQNTPHQGPSRLRNKAAPDIHNEEYFPTLSGAKPEPTGVWGRRPRSEGTFEEVRHSKASFARQGPDSRGQGAGPAQGPKLNLGNRYNTLSTNDS